MAQSIAAINQALESDDPAATLEALRAPAAAVRSVTDECAETYHEKLALARQEKVEAGESQCVDVLVPKIVTPLY